MIFFDLIKALSLSLFTYLIYIKLRYKKRVPLSRRLFVGFIYTAVSVLTLMCLSMYITEPFKSILAIFISGFVLKIVENTDIKRSVFFIGISYALSKIFYLASTVISSFLFMAFFGVDELNIWLLILISVIQAILTALFYEIKFKTTIKYNKNTVGAGTALSGVALIIYGVLRTDRLSDSQLTLLSAGVVLCGIGLYWLLKRESIAAYNEKIHKLMNLKLQAELLQLDEAKYFLEKNLHTQSKKLPAYEEAVKELIYSTENPEVMKKASRLFGEIQNVRTERAKEIWEPQERKPLPPTGVALIDRAFRYYNGMSAKVGINFELSINGDLTDIFDYITQSQLETLITNMLDNANNALKRAEQNFERCIAVRLWGTENGCGLSVVDTGEPFCAVVLADLERCKATLRPCSKGFGGDIGLATVFEIMQGCRGSIIISDLPGFKTVSLKFDNKDRLIIEKHDSRVYETAVTAR